MQRVVFYSGYQKREELICERKKTAREGKGVRLMMDSAWNKAESARHRLARPWEREEGGRDGLLCFVLFCFALLFNASLTWSMHSPTQIMSADPNIKRSIEDYYVRKYTCPHYYTNGLLSRLPTPLLSRFWNRDKSLEAFVPGGRTGTKGAWR